MEFYDLSALYILFSQYIHTSIVHTGIRKEIQKSDTERQGILPQPPWFFYVLSKAQIHGIDILRPQPTDEDEYDGYVH